MHWPYKQHKTSRNQKLLPYHQELKKAGACFGVSGGYERPMWFALKDEKAEYDYSFGHQNWYSSLEYETKNTTLNVGLYELTPFSKYEIKGNLAHSELQKLCTANIKNEIGKSTYTQMLNESGGIEADLTVICIDKDYFRIISSAATRTHDKAHILKNLSKDLDFKDVTDDYSCLGIFGPKSRGLLSKLSTDDFSKETFKFGDGKYSNINKKKFWIQRLSYVGELGYEIYLKIEDAKSIYNLIIEEGEKFKLSLCGSHAMDVMRMESGFLHWGHDISPEENQYQAGLNFAISYKKEVDFIGKKAVEKIKTKKLDRRFAMFTLQNNKPGEPLLLHEEPIYLEDKIIGKTTSGNYSFNFNKNLTFGYIKTDLTNKELVGKKLFVEVEKQKYPISVQLEYLKRTDFKNL